MTQAIWLLALFLGVALGSPSYFSGEEKESTEAQSEGSKKTSCPCGWSNRARVVGGRETEKNEFPFIVPVYNADEETVFCGGSIITSSVALTAAHCTYPNKDTVQLGIIIGEHDLHQDSTNKSAILVKETVEHEKYNDDTYEYDIALLILDTQITFTQTVGPVCMPTGKRDFMHVQLTLLGWGKLSTHGSKSDVLMKVNLFGQDLEKCVAPYKDTNPIDLVDRRQICTFRKNKDSCQGDSGGPLIWKDDETNRYVQVALVSFGKDCASAEDPAINTDVGAYIDWIKEKIKIHAPEGGEVCQKIN